MRAKTRPRHTRTRRGCLTCRTRKKKCDEIKPRCAGCRRNQLPCEWPPGVLNSRDSAAADVLAASDAGVSCLVARVHVDTLPPAGSPPAPVPVLHGGTQRACSLTPQSVSLLAHYLGKTASNFAMTPLEDNPFVTILLPLGHMDDLLMHGLLALSGTHLAYKEPGSAEIAAASRLHYAKLISGLRAEFAHLQEDDFETTSRLLRILMVACHHEAVSGDTSGVIFHHLRAAHHLLTRLLANKRAHHGWQVRHSLGFSVEMYTYLVLCNTLTPHGTAVDGALPLEPFIMSMDEMISFPTFGVLFAGSHELFRLIPEVSLLASRRLAEEAAGSPLPSEPLKAIHEKLYSRIKSWEMPARGSGEATKGWGQRCRAAEAYREALHIYLATALAGSTVTDPAVICTIQDHVNRLFSCVQQLLGSQYLATMLWPTIVAGTCTVKPEQRQLVAREMCWYSMRHLRILGDVLQLLWKDPDPRAYGPYGLRLVMEKHGLSIGID